MISTIQTLITPHELLLDVDRECLINSLADLYGYSIEEFDGLNVNDIVWFYLTEEQCIELVTYIN